MRGYWQPTYTKRDGTVVRGHWVRGSNRRTNAPIPPPSSPPPSHPQPAYPSSPPVSNHAAPHPRKKRRKTAIAITATAVITAGAVTFTVAEGGSAGASDSVSVQANIDFNQVMAELPKLGFAGSVPLNGAPGSSQDCSQNSTGDVKQFLVVNPCKEYAVTLIKLHKQGIATQAVISWVVMASPSLTLKYKQLVDERHRGNPPGQPTVFNGLCYASGQNDDAAWVAQVQPTGDVAVDQQILQAVAPAPLSTSYLRIHCVD
jgi:hypothetical protein